MTTEQLAAILAKAAEVYTLRTAYLAAQTEHNDAITAASNAEAGWTMGVNSGADEATLTDLINQHVAAEVVEAQTLEAMTTAKTPYDAACAELDALEEAAIADALAPPAAP